mgnify:CR=1 FL=1
MPIILDPVQETISKIEGGPVLVVSGPGSGKSRVITARTAHLVQNVGVIPERIFVVTFTKAAAEEVRSRIATEVGEELASRMHIRTIHSLCYRFLSAMTGKPNVQDKSSQARRVHQIFRTLELPEELLEPYLQERTNCLNRLRSLDTYQPSNMDRQQFKAVNRAYEKQQKAEGFLDQDDMLIEVYNLLKTSRQLEGRYIMVDEFQDTSLLQYEILKLLAVPTNNFFVVGDDDQSLYSWRGACNAPLLFKKDFPCAQEVSLATNYRSTKQVVSLSSALIANNKNRLPKELAAKQGAAEGSRPRFIIPKDERDEASRVADAIELAHREGVMLQDVAVIYRVNNQAFLIQHELAKRDIPYKILGGESQVLDHWVSKGLTGYLEAAMYPDNAELFFYILKRPNRFISNKEIEGAEEMVRQGVHALDAIRNQPLRESSRKAVTALESDLTKLHSMKARHALDYVRGKIGFDRYIQETASALRLDYEECQQIAEILCYLPDLDEGIEEFVRRLPELKNMTKRAKESNGVTLTTCHSSKGLEFQFVVLVGAVEGALPYSRAIAKTDFGEIEEERRLAYVAVTRSEDMLLLSSPETWQGRSARKSRFITEMREGLLYKQIVEGASFEHPVWGRCTWGTRNDGIVTIVKPDGEVMRTTIKWLQERDVI